MAASSSSSPPPPSSSVTMDGFTYDVFLSFRGKDTRYHFTSFLWKALEDKGIRTFFDKEDIQKGEEITKALPKAIEESRTAIVVLSPNYAESAFCLRELSHILDCIQGKGRGRVVWPVFYEVEPSDVRWSTGTYGKAMAEHGATSWYTPVQLQNWKNALQQVADLKGDRYYEWKNGINIYQYEFIDKIVKEVSKQIRPSTLFVTDYSIGLKQKREEVISLLNDEEVHMVGIHGLGGIGKTTLATEVYNFIASKFEGTCFLEKVRENSKKHGLTSLQKILLSKTVGEKEMNITSVPEGITVLQQRLRHKKILLLLDDVDNMEQLNAIIGTPSVATAGRPEWFGPGSRVIITTRDIGLLRSHGVENKYEVMGLNKKDALKLLRWKAFKSDDVISSYDGVLNRAVKYASGLPLALEVIGSHLFKREITYWNYTLEQYERSPHERIQAVLEVSYKALNKEQQSAFLDIACFFNGHKLAWVKKILHAHHGNRAEGHIEVLVEKSLIKINESSNVTLHDLIEDMGKEIVQRDLQEEPGRRSRLWNRNDIVSVLQDNMGTSEIEVIYLYSKNEIIYFYSKNEVIRDWDENEVKWDGEAFKRTNKLRILIIHGGIHFSTSPTYLPNSLTVLKWDGYPSEHLPHDFYPKKLAICELLRNKLTSIGRGDLFQKANKFENMRVLNLNYSYQLKEIANVSGLPNLEEFLFQKCEELVTIDHSVGLLGKLKILRASGCINIKSFPSLKLASLEELDISRCDSLESFPPVVDGLDKLQILRAGGCSKIKSFPPLKLVSLEEFEISYCDSLESFPPVVDGLLAKLQILRANKCGKLKYFPVPLKLDSLEELDISYCDSLESFPPVVDGLLDKLKILCATSCRKLKNFPVPLKLASLEIVDISYCDSLESFPSVVDGLLDKLQILFANKCGKLKNFPVSLKLASLEKLDISYCDSLESFPPVVDGLLDKLQILCAYKCGKLKNFPVPLKLASLEKLDISYCDSLESFPPVVDGLLAKLKILCATSRRKLKNFLVPLKLVSLKKLDISYCDSLESFPPVVDGLLDKLQIFCANKCGKLKNFSVPLKLASIEKLDISYCDSLESFPKISREMENITQLQLEETPIKELQFSFRNFTRLRSLYLSRCGITRLPSSIVMMSKLVELTIVDGGWLFPKQDEGEENVSPMQSSQVELLHLRNCILSDESLAIGLKWFANVKELDLSGSKFTTLPECIEKCQFLWKLILKDCKELQEIKGIPPSLKYLSAVNCESLTLSSKSKLLNRERERHESGNPWFCFPGSEIPEWFEHQFMQGESFSFWFRNKFPVIALSVVSRLTWDNSDPPVTLDIIGPAGAHLYVDMDSCKYNNVTPLKTPHLHFFRIQTKNFYHHLYKALLENQWHRAEVNFASPFQKRGFHLWKEKCNMEDIRFTSPENDVNTELIL